MINHVIELQEKLPPIMKSETVEILLRELNDMTSVCQCLER